MQISRPDSALIGPLYDPVTWYKITHAGEQVAQWGFQNKARCIILEAPLCNLLTGMSDFVPRNRVLQRTHLESHNKYEKITRFWLAESSAVQVQRQCKKYNTSANYTLQFWIMIGW